MLPSRTLLVMIFLAPCSLASAQEPSGKPGKERRPNILFLFADDWGRYASAYAGVDGPGSPNDVVKTPNVDRVAREGVLFRHAFVNAPSCTPCRSSILSGRYFWKTGRAAILSGAVWDPAIPSWPLLLGDAGYFIGKAFKVWSPGTPVDAPFGGQKYAYQQAGGLINTFSQNATRMVKEGMKFEKAREKILDEVRDNFRAFLKARPADQPFCFWFGPTNVHRTWVQGSGKALWNINPDDLKGKLPKFLPDSPEIREDFADYLGEVQAWDASVGALLKVLEEAGELDNTIIVISGDHGAPGFPRGKCNLYDFGVRVSLMARGPGIPGGRVVDDFTTLKDLAPTFLEIGQAPLPEGLQSKSLLPVLKSAKGGLVDPERTWVVTGRERHVDEARAGGLPYPQRALRTADFLYIRNFAPDRWPMGDPRGITADEAPPVGVLAGNTRVTLADMDASPTRTQLILRRNDPAWKKYYEIAFGKRPGEELFDIRQDPDHLQNLADDPKFQETRRALADRLLAILKENHDPRVLGDGTTFDRPPFTDAGPQKTDKKKAGKGR